MEKMRERVKGVVREGKRVAKEDPRRVIHSLKVGLSLALVSSFYYYQPLYDSFGVNAMWAVMTVVVVFEFSVGATLGKGLNRGVATCLAGSLGIGAHHLSSMFGPTAEPILLAIFVFSQAAVSTFIRFFPKVKARYDYGLLIFILTFSLVSVSGFREDEILEFAHKRVSTVIVGGVVCVLVSIFVCPVWAGQDLHDLIAANLAKLAYFLEEFGDEYFQGTSDSGDAKDDEKKRETLEGYKSVLNSKHNEESLANFARWEPRHGMFKFRHPWRQYLTVGTLIRRCGYRIDALHSYLKADIHVSMDIKRKLEESLRRMSDESGKAMKELSLAFKNMQKPYSSDLHLQKSNSAAKSLTSLLKSGIFKEIGPLEISSVVTITSLLIDIVTIIGEISDSIHELASPAGFKNNVTNPDKSSDVKASQVVTIVHDDHINGPIDISKNDTGILDEYRVPETALDCPHFAITIEESLLDCPQFAITIDESVHKKQELGVNDHNGDNDTVNIKENTIINI